MTAWLLGLVAYWPSCVGAAPTRFIVCSSRKLKATWADWPRAPAIVLVVMRCSIDRDLQERSKLKEQVDDAQHKVWPAAGLKVCMLLLVCLLGVRTLVVYRTQPKLLPSDDGPAVPSVQGTPQQCDALKNQGRGRRNVMCSCARGAACLLHYCLCHMPMILRPIGKMAGACFTLTGRRGGSYGGAK